MSNHNMHLYTHISTKKEERKYNKTLSDVLMLMVGLPIKIVSEEYHFTDEQCEELANHIISEYDAVQTDYADLTDSLEVLSEEANLLVSDIFKKYNLGKTRQDGAFYLVSGIFPLVPGAGIYYTAYYLISGMPAKCSAKGLETFEIALAIVFGIIFGFSIPETLFHKRKQ